MNELLNDEELLSFSARMKRDWNERAVEDAKWFINTVSQGQSDEEFFESGRQELNRWWLPDFQETLQGRELRKLNVLELGCGIGRMTCHLAERFGEVWAADVSSEMIARAKERFAHLRNVNWVEIDGVSLAGIPDNYFDLAFSIYVFQHVPSKQVISAAMTNAYRKIKPGGFLKAHTNGLVKQEYEELEKDTWKGATFSEQEVRALVSELGGQLISVLGGGTQYCWSTIRKPALGVQTDLGVPKIVAGGWAEDLAVTEVPVSGDQAMLGLVVSGLNKEAVDCNSVRVVIDDKTCLPHYVGAIRQRHAAFVTGQLQAQLQNLTYLEANVPEGWEAKVVNVAVEVLGQRFSEQFPVRLTGGGVKRPKIVTVRNGADYGTDIYAKGAKSLLYLYVHDLDETANTENVRLRLNDLDIAPDFVGFVTQNGTWQVNAQLPDSVEPGSYELRLVFRSVESEAVQITLH
jgi:ubiquinone/menaquinone biosynthesis C-methylase UbiE